MRSATWGQTSVGVSPAQVSVVQGGTVTLNIIVTNVVNLHQYHVVVHFDNTIIRCDAVTRGGFLSSGPFFFSIPPVLPSDTARFIAVDEAMQGTGTNSGSGTLFSLRFTALQSGVSPVSFFEVILRNGLNENISASAADGIVTVTDQVSTTTRVAAGWNLLSVPLVVNDYRKMVLYPTATSSAYRFQGGYVPAETLANGIGYWLKFPSVQDVTMIGTLMTADTIDVMSGWNIIGPISSPVLPSDVHPIPPVVIQSSFFGYGAMGYATADTLKPGKGYWVKTIPGGTLVISPGISATTSNVK